MLEYYRTTVTFPAPPEKDATAGEDPIVDVPEIEYELQLMRADAQSKRLEDVSADLQALQRGMQRTVETLEAIAPLWKRVLGESHPETPAILRALKEARKALAARAASSSSAA